MSGKSILHHIYICFVFVLLTSNVAFAQTTVFNYQGRLSEAGTPVTGTRFFRLTLFDENGAAITGATIEQIVPVTNGVFSVALDFGAGAFPGANRTLEIAVKLNAGDAYTVLNPRQQINSTPYAIRSLNSGQAEIAANANQLGGVDASEYVTTTSVGSSFIRNSTMPQTGDFNVSGDGTLGGVLQATEIRAQTLTGTFGLTQTDGTTTVGTYVGGSTSGASGGWFGTVSNSDLHFFTNNGQPKMTISQNGNVGIGTANPQSKLQLVGNASQDRTSGGLIKAMLAVDADGTILRCYNGTTGASAGNCGFTVTAGASGNYAVNLGFQVNDRFLSVTARGINGTINFPVTPISADFRFSSLANANPNEVFIDTFHPDTRATVNNPFILIVY
jgi:hypothetical protein